jgi:excisionase family DNA binding protein
LSQDQTVVPLVFTIYQTAALLTVSPRTIWNLIRAGELVGRKIGTRTVIPKTSVESFLRRDHATMSGAEHEARKKARDRRREPL